MMFKERITSI